MTDRPSAQDEALDLALTASLRPPALPLGFRAGLMAAIARDAAADAQARRLALEAEHAAGQALLRQGFVRLRREVLAWALALAFAAGGAASVVLPWLAAAWGTDVLTLAPFAAAGTVLLLVVLVWLDRWDWISS